MLRVEPRLCACRARALSTEPHSLVLQLEDLIQENFCFNTWSQGEGVLPERYRLSVCSVLQLLRDSDSVTQLRTTAKPKTQARDCISEGGGPSHY